MLEQSQTKNTCFLINHTYQQTNQTGQNKISHINNTHKTKQLQYECEQTQRINYNLTNNYNEI